MTKLRKKLSIPPKYFNQSEIKHDRSEGLLDQACHDIKSFLLDNMLRLTVSRMSFCGALKQNVMGFFQPPSMNFYLFCLTNNRRQGFQSNVKAQNV